MKKETITRWRALQIKLKGWFKSPKVYKGLIFVMRLIIAIIRHGGL